MSDFAVDKNASFELLLSHLHDFAVVLLDSQGRFTSWHPGVEAHFGYAREEFLGRSGEILFPPADRLQNAFDRELQTARTVGRASDTNWLITKSGRLIFVEGVTLALRNPRDGALIGYGKVLRDVTERKHTEDSLRKLTGALDQSAVFILSREGIIEHWTSGCQRLYGWSESEALGRSADDLLQTNSTATTEAIWGQLQANGVWQGELQQIRKDGSLVLVSGYWVLFAAAEDAESIIIATHADITLRLAMQRELEGANTQLKSMAIELARSNADLEEFARIASHDLSAPITSTRWLVDLLSARHGGSLNAEGQGYLRQISLGLARMTDLVEGILAHARVGKESIHASEPASAEVALDIAIDHLRKDLDVSRATITRRPLPNVLIEAQALAQLFQNLLSNSVKYRRPAVPLEIEISADLQGSFWLISVRDNGIGIEPEWIERIFQPMQRRADAAIAGSGIGLATCRKIVARAGGEIRVESEPGEGATFLFTVPRAAE